MVFLKDIEQIRAIEWGASYQWDIMIPSAPSPFDAWFPAADVDEDLANLETYAFDSSQHTFKIPRSGTQTNLRITFYDDVKHTLLYWFENWINNTILNHGKYVTPLLESVKLVQLTKLNSRREVMRTSSYFVFPEGPVQFSGKTQSDVNQYSVSFVIAGKGPISDHQR